jgi:uncharacterized integral membrane protein
MPGRLIVFIVLFLVFFLFIVFNLENKTDISFGFTKLPDIPVFVTAFFSFLAGMFCTFPFIFRKRKKLTDVKAKVKGKGLLARAVKKQDDSVLVADKSHYGID